MKKSEKVEEINDPISNHRNQVSNNPLRKIIKFKTLEEQELYFLSYFYNLSPIERLRALASLQIRNRTTPLVTVKKITILKHHLDQ